MHTSKKRSLDRRVGAPRDYLVDPRQFGHDSAVAVRVPDGGDVRSLQVAYVQHLVACALRHRSGLGPGQRLALRFGFSRQHWSNCLAGATWMGETLMAAAVAELLDLPDPEIEVR